jgi:hypothetical protein
MSYKQAEKKDFIYTMMLLVVLLTVLCVYFVQVYAAKEHYVTKDPPGPPEQIRIVLRGPMQ